MQSGSHAPYTASSSAPVPHKPSVCCHKLRSLFTVALQNNRTTGQCVVNMASEFSGTEGHACEVLGCTRTETEENTKNLPRFNLWLFTFQGYSVACSAVSPGTEPGSP